MTHKLILFIFVPYIYVGIWIDHHRTAIWYYDMMLWYYGSIFFNKLIILLAIYHITGYTRVKEQFWKMNTSLHHTQIVDQWPSIQCLWRSVSQFSSWRYTPMGAGCWQCSAISLDIINAFAMVLHKDLEKLQSWGLPVLRHLATKSVIFHTNILKWLHRKS